VKSDCSVLLFKLVLFGGKSIFPKGNLKPLVSQMNLRNQTFHALLNMVKLLWKRTKLLSHGEV